MASSIRGGIQGKRGTRQGAIATQGASRGEGRGKPQGGKGKGRGGGGNATSRRLGGGDVISEGGVGRKHGRTGGENGGGGGDGQTNFSSTEDGTCETTTTEANRN